MGPTWVLSAPGGPHVGPMNHAIRIVIISHQATYYTFSFIRHWFCNLPALTTSLVFRTGLIPYSELRASTLTNSGQRVRPPSEKLAGQLDCHIPPSLNGTRHPCLAARHSHQARNMTISQLWVNYQCAGLYPSLWTSPQCTVPGTNNPTGIRTWVDSILRVVSQCSSQLGQRPTSERLAGASRLDCHIFNCLHFKSFSTSVNC